MFASGQNSTDPECFQQCNEEWKEDFEKELQISCSDFYDFPFHPKILQYNDFIKYCKIAEKQTKCYIKKCGDESADRVFSPSNFLCQFKRSQFLTARPCLEDTEPITFLKCDHACHAKAAQEAKEMNRAHLGKVFTNNELDKYEREVKNDNYNNINKMPKKKFQLSLLCSFQECYRDCHKPILEESCSRALADATIDLIQAYVQWHATDIYDWHILSENVDKLPESCSRLTGYNPNEDPVLKIMNNIA
uniref:Uncharacterized protein n=1 Tax=Panagrolaimus superbus TaxID=310955 RepID=A0A914Y238_9BILA